MSQEKRRTGEPCLQEQGVKMKKVTLGVLAALALTAAPAFAGSATANVAVSANVANVCTISTGAVAFGAYDPIVTNASAALETSGASPDRAIMIGDTPYDIEAARRAGLATIAFRCGGWDDAALQGSIAIYDDPQELLDHLSRWPFLTPRTSSETPA